MVRYYRDWVPDPDHELPPDQAQRLPRFARGLLREDGSIERLELYERGTLSRVDYYEGGVDEDIGSKHHDFAHGEQASFDALKDELEDATFYADGFALPGSITGTPIPGP